MQRVLDGWLPPLVIDVHFFFFDLLWSTTVTAPSGTNSGPTGQPASRYRIRKMESTACYPGQLSCRPHSLGSETPTWGCVVRCVLFGVSYTQHTSQLCHQVSSIEVTAFYVSKGQLPC